MATRWPLVALVAVALCWGVTAHESLGQADAAQNPSTATGAPARSAGEYVGAARCGTCHAELHALWTSGRHSRMLQPATATAVVGDFSKGDLTLDGHAYRVESRDGAFFITESELSGKPQQHRVDYTLGSRRIQHYLATRPNGEIVVLSPTWDVERREWFHNAEIVRPADSQRQIVQQWNRNCVGCHVSGQENHYDPIARTYRTEWTDFGTSCERCHGPGARHAQGTWADPQSARASIVKPTRLDPRAGSMVCAQCHSLRTAINPDYTPGADYYDFFMPALEYGLETRPLGSRDPAYWADSRPRRFSNDAIGLWQSACFLRGGATCTTCHTNPHLPDVDRNPQLAGASSDRLCASCHQEIAARQTDHTRHPASSAGSVCVECHMPRTVVSIKATMRDHTISVPAPENTAKFDIPNACTECHRGKSASWAAGVLRSWYPDGKRQRLIAQAEAFSAARAGRTGAIDKLIGIAADESSPPLVRANAIGYLGRFADPRASNLVVRAASSEETIVRLTAVAALRGPAGTNEASRAVVLAALGDPRRAVRFAAALTVAERGGRDLQPADRIRFRTVGNELLSWTQRHQDDADLQRLQGLVQLLGGDIHPAADALANSLALDPDAALTKFLLGLARLGQGRDDDARRLWKEIPRGSEYYASAQQQLNALGSK